METKSAVAALGALAHETRLSVFRMLIAEGPEGLAAGEIARRLGTAPNTMSSHLAVLERNGIVTAERRGRSIVYRADLAGARNLFLYLLADCCGGRPEICAPVVDVLGGVGACDPAAAPECRGQA